MKCIERRGIVGLNANEKGDDVSITTTILTSRTVINLDHTAT